MTELVNMEEHSRLFLPSAVTLSVDGTIPSKRTVLGTFWQTCWICCFFVGGKLLLKLNTRS